MANANKNSGRKKKNIDTTFSKKLTALLDDAKAKSGTVQKDVAEKIGVSRQALGKWAHGETVPDILDLKKLSEYFNVSADYLIGTSDVPSLDTNVQAVCDYTGLSEKAINEIRCFTEVGSNERNYNYAKILSDFIENNGIELLDILSKFQKEVKSWQEKSQTTVTC